MCKHRLSAWHAHSLLQMLQHQNCICEPSARLQLPVSAPWNQPCIDSLIFLLPCFVACHLSVHLHISDSNRSIIKHICCKLTICFTVLLTFRLVEMESKAKEAEERALKLAAASAKSKYVFLHPYQSIVLVPSLLQRVSTV